MEKTPTYEELLKKYNEAEQIICKKEKEIASLKKSRGLFKKDHIFYNSISLFADLLPIVVTLVDLQGNCLYLNQFGRYLSGYDLEDLSNGLNVRDLLVQPEDFQLFAKKVAAPHNHHDMPKGEEFLIKNKREELFYVLIYSRIIKSWENKPVLLGILIDHSNYRKVSDEYIKAEQKLREMNAAKDKFFSIIAHDLKSPFNAILGFSELILSNTESYSLEQIISYTSVIQKSASKGLGLLDNLLKWSMNQTGKLSFKMTLFDLAELIPENVDFVNEKAAIKGITISYECESQLMVKADKNMIDTVLRNLLSNAIKFTRANGYVHVSVKQVDNFSNKSSIVHITIADDGVGIAERDLKKLFRVDTHFSTQGTAFEQGSGLGLVLCRDFINKHKGNIWAESTVGEGSKFHFTLPVDKELF